MKYAVITIVMAVVLILFLGYRMAAPPYIDFAAAGENQSLPAYDNEDQRPLRIALASVLSPNETIGYYRTIADHISHHTGRKVTLIQRKTYSDIILLMSNGDVDVAFFSTGAYASYQGMNEIELLVMAHYMGNSLYQTDVVVHKDSQITSIEELQGKVFAFTDPLSYSGHLVILDVLNHNHTTPERFFSRYFYTYNHDKSLWAVANKIADGASLDSQIYEYAKEKKPELTENIRIIKSLGPAPTGPVVISKKVSREQVKQLQDVFLSMHTDPETAKALRGLMIDKFVVPVPELYEPLRNLYREKRELL